MGWDGMDGISKVSFNFLPTLWVFNISEEGKIWRSLVFFVTFKQKPYKRGRRPSLRMDGMGWDGTGYQKCPSIFFILCGYIDYVYIYLYTE